VIEGEDDQAYRVHLLHGSWGLLLARLWGTTIGANAPTYFDGDEVRKKRGKRGWPVDYWDAIRSKKFEIWGQRPGEDTWRPLSRELLAEDRLARSIAAALAEPLGRAEAISAATPELEPPDPVDRAIELLREVMERVLPAPGRAEAALHLLDHEEMRRDHALRAMRKVADWEDITSDDVKRLRSDGKRRLRKPGETCRFCPPPSPSGIPTA
jgi:hypothetical protein